MPERGPAATVGVALVVKFKTSFLRVRALFRVLGAIVREARLTAEFLRSPN